MAAADEKMMLHIEIEDVWLLPRGIVLGAENTAVPRAYMGQPFFPPYNFCWEQWNIIKPCYSHRDSLFISRHTMTRSPVL